MPDNTTRGVPFALGTDPNDLTMHTQALAEWVDDHPGVSPLTTAERDALAGSALWAGRVILNTTAGRLERYDAVGLVWRSASVADHGDLTGLGDDDHPQYLNTARHDTVIRHGAAVVDHGQIGGLGDDDHPQYLKRGEQLDIDAEQNIRLWQLEADLLGTTEGMSGWQGEAFLTGQDNVATVTGDVEVKRASRLGQGGLVIAADPLAGVAIGDPFMGGYFAGVMDTTTGNIIPADASQVGQRYALIVSPKTLEQASLTWKDAQTAAPAASRTRWDGLAATVAMASTTYPAANYCHGLTFPADDASRWYLPAMDELELIYRNLKSTTESNYTTDFTSAAGSFPLDGAVRKNGYNPSSDPTGAAYTAGSPAQTAVTAFRDGGGQDLGDATVNQYFWASTEYSATTAWVQLAAGSSAGSQSYSLKTVSTRVRPVRRLVL